MDDLSPQTRALLECARKGDELPRARRRVLRRRAAAAVGVALPLTLGGKIAAGMGAVSWLVRGLAIVGVAGAVAAGVASFEPRVGRPLPASPTPAPPRSKRGVGSLAAPIAMPPAASARPVQDRAAPDEERSQPERASPVQRGSGAVAALAPSTQAVPRSGALRSLAPAIAEGPASTSRERADEIAPEPPSALEPPVEGDGTSRLSSRSVGALPVRAVDELAEETRLLADAQRALEGGGAERALALLAEHDRLFPSGALEPESGALRVDAFCAGGRWRDAQAEAARFRAHHPGSPLARRASFRCADASGIASPRVTR